MEIDAVLLRKIIIGLIIFIGFSLLILLLIKYLLPAFKNAKHENDDLEFIHEKLDLNQLTKISNRFNFYLDKLFTNGEQYYFDENFVYVFDKKKGIFKIELDKIKYIGKTNFEINKNDIWEVGFELNDEQRRFLIIPSNKLTNNGFISFMKYMKKNYHIPIDSFSVVKFEMD